MATNMYNPDGGISAIWLKERQMELEKERQRQKAKEYEEMMVRIHERTSEHNSYEEAFNFLKQHSTTLTDEEIALEVIRSMRK